MYKNKEKYLIENFGFKKKYLEDKSGFWLEKKFKIDEFDAFFYYDGSFCHIDIKTYHCIGNKKYKTYTDTIWKGSYKNFLKKIQKYS